MCKEVKKQKYLPFIFELSLFRVYLRNTTKYTVSNISAESIAQDLEDAM